MIETSVMRQTILLTVSSHQGLKGVELVLKVMDIVNPHNFTESEYNKELESLVHRGEIIELEYILPMMDYRVKSMYFPKGTTFRVMDWF